MVLLSNTAAGRNALLLAAVGAIYDAAAQPQSWPLALAAIAAVFGAKGTVLLYNRDDGGMTAIVSPGLEAAVADYDREWWRHDIRVQRGVERALLSQVGVYTDRDIGTPQELASHPFYTQFLAKHGLGYFMGGSVSPHPRVFAGLSVQGPLGAEPYSDEDVALLAVLGRHVEKALRLSVRLIEAEAASLALGDALSRLRAGAIIINEKRQVLFCNSAATELLGDGLRAPDRSSRQAFAIDSAALTEAIADAMADTPSADFRPVLIGVAARDRPLVAYALPVRPAAAKDDAFVGATALVLFIDQEAGAPVDPSLVRDLLNLTLGEARVASLVGCGRTPREAASMLGIAEETARTVLKRVYSKIGVSRQSELTAILARATLAAA